MELVRVEGGMNFSTLPSTYSTTARILFFGKTMEVEKKKGKSKSVKVDPEDEDAKRQEVVKVEMLVAELALDDVVVEEKTSARM